jgi:FkbM family methyltransferase
LAKALIQAIRSIVRSRGFDVVRYRPTTLESELQGAITTLARLRELAAEHLDRNDLAFIEYCATHFRDSKAQIFQDLFVQYALRDRRDGFFVEFGATNGVALSNTFLLEKQYGWNGVLAEPAKIWHADLRKNRNCILDFRSVWDKDDEQLEFNQADIAELSTINSFADSDFHAAARRKGEIYSVTTVSLNSLLRQHDAPTNIDYMSVDTEGSELKILSAFDFSRYRVRVITVEHNYTPDRERIHALLTSKGFTRKFESLSFWDDWYVASGEA